MFLFFQRYLPREVDPLVYNMSHEDPGSVSYSEIGGLSEQIRELREVQQSLETHIKQYSNSLICCTHSDECIGMICNVFPKGLSLTVWGL